MNIEKYSFFLIKFYLIPFFVVVAWLVEQQMCAKSQAGPADQQASAVHEQLAVGDAKVLRDDEWARRPSSAGAPPTAGTTSRDGAAF